MRNSAIFGVCGSIGKSLLANLVNKSKKNSNKLYCYDNNEENLFYLKKKYNNQKNVLFSYLDIRNYTECLKSLKNIDVVYHVAAMKHVEICEYSPIEAINTNALGTENLINASRENKVKKFIYASTDKAVNPTNVMGTSKLLAEKLVTAANLNNDGGTSYSTVRFGNVLGSTGSIIPLLKKNFFNNENLTLTDKKMSRFIMSMSKAVDLIIKCEKLMKGGEVFIIKMKALLIKDLIDVLANELAKKYNKKVLKIKIIGKQYGEKLYEELMNEEEIRRSYELKDYIVILPAYGEYFKKDKFIKFFKKNFKLKDTYNSKNSKYLSKKKISKILHQEKLI